MRFANNHLLQQTKSPVVPPMLSLRALAWPATSAIVVTASSVVTGNSHTSGGSKMRLGKRSVYSSWVLCGMPGKKSNMDKGGLDIQHAEIHKRPGMLAACDWTVLETCCLRSVQWSAPPASTARAPEEGSFGDRSQSARSLSPALAPLPCVGHHWPGHSS